jgi:hypothetical protein
MSAIESIPPAHLYKYVSGVRIKGLLQNRIRFTQASAQDDPFELRPIFDVACTSEDLLEEVVREAPVEQLFEKQYGELSTAERAAVPPLPVLMAFIRQRASKDLIEPLTALMRPIVAEMLARVRSEIERVLSGRIGILSLTEDPLSIRMWSHYADGHRGAAIEFDTTHPWFDRQRSDADEHTGVGGEDFSRAVLAPCSLATNSRQRKYCGIGGPRYGLAGLTVGQRSARCGWSTRTNRRRQKRPLLPVQLREAAMETKAFIGVEANWAPALLNGL